MATATTLVPLEEYLATSYEHDPEWVNGELRERGMSDDYHSAIQTLLVAYFRGLRMKLGVRVTSERRTRMSAGSYRIPDVALFREDAPFGDSATGSATAVRGHPLAR